MKPQTQASVSLYIDTQKLVFLPTSTGSTGGAVVGTTTGAVVGWVCLPMVIVGPPIVADAVRPIGRGTRVAERMQRLENNPQRAAAVVRAHQRLGRALVAAGDQRFGLAALRLQAGFSQHALAERMSTQQANISRWESASVDLQASSIVKLAKVLGVSPATVLEAILLPVAENSNG